MNIINVCKKSYGNKFCTETCTINTIWQTTKSQKPFTCHIIEKSILEVNIGKIFSEQFSNNENG